MKIVLINAVCRSGSTGSICRDLAENYIRNGNKCVIYYGNRDSDYTYAKKISTRVEVKINSFLARLTGLQGYFSYISTFNCIHLLRVEEPDVVHIHNVHGNYINVPMLLSFLKKNRIRTVITLHDCWFYTGKCTHYTEAGCYKWMKECGECPLLKADIPSYIFDRTKKMFLDKKKCYQEFEGLSVIAVSDWIANQAKQSILKNTTIETIYNWVDLKVFHPDPVERHERFIILGVSAKWVEGSAKLEDFIQLSKMLDDSEEIWLVGMHESKSKLPDNIVCIPYADEPEKLSQIYNKADVYVHLAREDSFGKVIIEAMACGTPVIVYNSTAYPEIVKDGSGYVTEVGNLEQVYCSIQNVKHNGKKYYLDACVQCASKYEKQSIIDATFRHYTCIK